MRSLVYIIFILFLSIGSLNAKESLGRFGNWAGQSYSYQGKSACNIYSIPLSHKEAGKKRGDIYIFVTSIPKLKRYNEISLYMGYKLRAGSTVNVKIDKRKYKFFTTKEQPSFAYSNAKDDKALIKYMKRGKKMIVTGVSKFGTKTTDIYSLSGFTKALKKINIKCKK